MSLAKDEQKMTVNKNTLDFGEFFSDRVFATTKSFVFNWFTTAGPSDKRLLILSAAIVNSTLHVDYNRLQDQINATLELRIYFIDR